MKFAARRLVQAVAVMFGVSTVLFLLLHLVPGGPALALAGPDATPATLHAIKEQYGLNNPLWQQYGHWLAGVVTGDLGTSVIYDVPVSQLMGQALQPTLQLVFGAMIVSVVVGVGLGVLAATKARRPIDVVIGYLTAGLLGMPQFWLGILLLILFALNLRWVPAGGYASIFTDPVTALQDMALPVIVMGVTEGCVIARFVRGSMLEVLSADYIRTARAKGAPRRVILFRHALRNALIPTMTVVAIMFGVLLGGTVVIEQVFARPGMGQLLTTAVGNRDYSIVQGVVLVLVAAFTLINLLVDLAYGLVDPRIRR